MPGRLVASAKSWLCHRGVDRQARDPAVGRDATGRKLSPVDGVGARPRAPRAARGRTPTGRALADEEVVLTVPASFDEVARELTVARRGQGRASATSRCSRSRRRRSTPGSTQRRRATPTALGRRRARAGLRRRRRHHRLHARSTSAPTATRFARTAVGDHLLLGGDNMDLALARRVEARLARGEQARRACSGSGLVARLPARQGDAARRRARRDAVPITVAGARRASSSAATLRDELTRAEVEELVLDGFFPLRRARRAPPSARRARPAGVRPALRRRPGDHAPPRRVPRAATARRASTPSCSTAAR